MAIVPKTEDIIILEDHEYQHDMRCILSNLKNGVQGVSWYLGNEQLYDPTEGYYFTSGSYDDKKFSQEFKLIIKNDKLSELRKQGGREHMFTCKVTFKQGSEQEETSLSAASGITIFSPSKTSNDLTVPNFFQYRCLDVNTFSYLQM